MPTEVFELSPQQLDWLYEHQTLKTVDGFHHLEVISPTATPHPTPKPVSPPRNQHFVDLRRDSMTHDSCTASSTSHTSMRTQSPELEGIIFPFNDERPSWEQSLSNLLCYKERHGVSIVFIIKEEENSLELLKFTHCLTLKILFSF